MFLPIYIPENWKKTPYSICFFGGLKNVQQMEEMTEKAVKQLAVGTVYFFNGKVKLSDIVWVFWDIRGVCVKSVPGRWGWVTRADKATLGQIEKHLLIAPFYFWDDNTLWFFFPNRRSQLAT